MAAPVQIVDGKSNAMSAHGSTLGTAASPLITASVDASGAVIYPSTKSYYTLYLAGVASQIGPVTGGDYIWRAESSSWNSATATLQFLGLDGATWYPVRNAANSADITLTANGSVAIGVAQGSVLRVNLTGGTPTSLNSALGGL